MKVYIVEIQNNMADGTDNYEEFLHASFEGALNRLKKQNFDSLDGEITKELFERIISENHKARFFCKLENNPFGFNFLDKNQYAYINVMDIYE